MKDLIEMGVCSLKDVSFVVRYASSHFMSVLQYSFKLMNYMDVIYKYYTVSTLSWKFRGYTVPKHISVPTCTILVLSVFSLVI